MTKNTSLVTFLLDRSGSMGSCKAATIEGFNAYLDGLQKEEDAAIDFTFLQFDTQSIDKVCVAMPVRDVRPLTSETYQPRGGTPLIDAAVKTIKAVEASLASRTDSPRVVICLQTDGEENSSTEHTLEELQGLIAAKREAGWEFTFLGAGLDAYAVGASLGIAAVSTMSYNVRDASATKAAFSASAQNAASFSAGRSMNAAYSMSQRYAAGDAYVPEELGGAPVAADPGKAGGAMARHIHGQDAVLLHKTQPGPLSLPVVSYPVHGTSALDLSKPQPSVLGLTPAALAQHTPGRRKTVPDIAL